MDTGQVLFCTALLKSAEGWTAWAIGRLVHRSAVISTCMELKAQTNYTW